jgi:hypothetical protein
VGKPRASRRSDDQLMGLLDSAGSWSVNDQRGAPLLCHAGTLREAVEVTMWYQIMKQDVGAVCWETRENIIVFRQQLRRLAGGVRRRIRISPSMPPVPIDGRSELIAEIVQCVDLWCRSHDARSREDISCEIDMLELKLMTIEARLPDAAIEDRPGHVQPTSLSAV